MVRRPIEETLSEREVNLVVLPPAKVVPALVSKKIAESIVTEPVNAAIKSKTISKVQRFIGDIRNDPACCLVLVHGQEVKRRPACSQRMVNAIVAAQRWMQGHRHELAEILAREGAAITSRTARSLSPPAGFQPLLIALQSGVLIRRAAASLLRVLTGLMIAVLRPIPMSLLLGLNRRLELTTSVVFESLRMISPLFWMPIAVMVLGVGDLPVFFLLDAAALWPILLTAPPQFARSIVEPARWPQHCDEPLDIVSRVVLPAIRANLLASICVTLRIMMVVQVPIEMPVSVQVWVI